MKKGFTLIEMIACMVLVGLISIVAIPKIQNQIANKKKDINNASLEIIYQAADLYMDNNEVKKCSKQNDNYCVTLDELVSNGYLDKNIINYTNGNKIPLNNYVKTTFNNFNEYSDHEITETCTTTVDNTNCESTPTPTPAREYLYDKISLGEYVKLTPIPTSYNIRMALTGADSNQFINPSLMQYWRVINKKNDGTIELVSEYVQGPVTFQGETGYKNLVGTLNLIAAQYYNDKYTLPNRVAPYFREIGYDGQTEYITGDLTTANAGNMNSDYDTSACAIGGDLADYDISEKNGGIGGDNLYWKDLQLLKNALGPVDLVQLGWSGYHSENGIDTNYIDRDGVVQYYNYDGYYLASRHYNGDGVWGVKSAGHNCNGQRTLYEPRCADSNIWCYQDGIETGATQDASYYVRPIITLKANIEVPSGDGKSISTAWDLN